MNLEEAFKFVKKEFCSLWSLKERGNTIEIVTSFSTTTSKFVSVFLTFRNEKFIISDGGWLQSKEYGDIDSDDISYNKLFEHYLNSYGIKKHVQSELSYYYKYTADHRLLGSLVSDMCSFITGVASASQIQFAEKIERQEERAFSTNARELLSNFIPIDRLLYDESLGKELKEIKFNAIVKLPESKLSLIRFVTGSQHYTFSRNVSDANMAFQIAKSSQYSSQIQSQIAVINDQAKGYSVERVGLRLRELSKDCRTINWSEQNILQQQIYNLTN